MNSVAAVQKDLHAQIKINDSDMSHLAKEHLGPLLIHEFTQASGQYPVAFVKNSATGQFQAVCVLGLKPGENLFVQDNQWRGGYLPLSLRNHPLCLIASEQDANQFAIGIHETSLQINFKQGQSLFNADGSETDYFKQRQKDLLVYFEKDQISQTIVKYLVELNLLQEEKISITAGADNKILSGVYLVNEEKLNNLPDSDFLELRKRGLLPPIYAHLSSFQYLGRLMELSAKNS